MAHQTTKARQLPGLICLWRRVSVDGFVPVVYCVSCRAGRIEYAKVAELVFRSAQREQRVLALLKVDTLG